MNNLSKNSKFRILLMMMVVIGLFTTSCKDEDSTSLDLSGSYSGTLQTTYSNCPGSSNTQSNQTYTISKKSNGDYILEDWTNICNGEKITIPSSGDLDISFGCNNTNYNFKTSFTSNKMTFETRWTSNGCTCTGKGDFYK